MLVLDTFNLEAGERALCAEAIRCGNLRRAADLLGIHPEKLRRRMTRYGLVLPDEGNLALMRSGTVAFASAFLREFSSAGIDVSEYASSGLVYAEVASWLSFVHPTVVGAQDVARGLVASVHAQALDTFEVQQLADVIERRSAPAVEYVDAVRWSIIKAEEALIRAKLLGLRSGLGWEKIHARLESIDPRLARRFRARHTFLREMMEEARR